MKNILLLFFIVFSLNVSGEKWLEIGANPQATFFIDLDSVEIKKDSVTILKKGIYNNVLTEIIEGKSVVFNQTLGLVEMDCKLKVNRVLQIKMINQSGIVVWASKFMNRRPWESVKKNSHAEKTFIEVCDNFHKI